MAGYSGTPLVKKLGIKAGHRLALLNAPDGFSQTLVDLPADLDIITSLSTKAKADVILYFTKSEAEYKKQFERLVARLDPKGGLWVCWPKKASKVPTDVTEDVIRKHALEAGLVDNKVCAVDETWSGLRIVFRVVDRPR
ncbi:MAG: DUF3052 family protein [Planctomycetes bacterium]|nr:DUF3052 family protein [Planctomycetota bacterium]